MSQKNINPANDFEMLLLWLDKNQEDAALKYEQIRRKLIRIFSNRGCHEAEELADETFDRVSKKISLIIENYTGEPSLYCYGVAYKVHHEWLRRQSKIKPLDYEDRPQISNASVMGEHSACLEKCLGELPDNQQKLIVKYYSDTKKAKIDLRKRIAEDLGISGAALQIKIFRIRNRLRDCIKGCVEKKV